MMVTRRERRYSDGGKRRAGGIPFHRRHRKLLIALFAFVVVVPIVGGASYAYMLNSKLNSVEKVPTVKDTDRPDPDKGRALNVLLLGSDKAKKIKGQPVGTTISEDAKADEWPAGKYRSDTLMIVHISADRKHVYLTSIPRDTFTTIYDAEGQPQHQEKINAAFSEFGPLGAISTVEHLTNLRMEHLAIIDWAGFRALSTAVGGVEVTIPRAFYDPKQHIQWEAGTQVLEGKQALAYVRTRYGLLRGDFDRIARQQNFLRSLMKKILDKGTMTNPVKLINTVSALSAGDTAWMLTATLLVVLDWLERAVGAESKKRAAVVTSAGRGDLSALAERREYATFDLPASVGGRFSVLSPVGLLPAALSVVCATQLWSPDSRAWFDTKNGITRAEPTPDPDAPKSAASAAPVGTAVMTQTEQPKPVRIAGLVTLVASWLVVMFSAYYALIYTTSRQSYIDSLSKEPTKSMLADYDLAAGDVARWMFIGLSILGILAIAACVAAALMLIGKPHARIATIVLAAVTVPISFVVVGVGWPWTAAAIFVLVQLRRPAARTP
mgnify:CR=1 FL=1